MSHWVKDVVLYVVMLSAALLVGGVSSAQRPLPDNVEYETCTALPDGDAWTIQAAWSSAGSVVSTLVSPLVGDLDGDGIPEIVCFGSAGQSGAPNKAGVLLVYDGQTHALKSTINMPRQATAFAASPYGLIRLAGGSGLIVVAHTDCYLRAYDFTLASPLVWTSDQPYGSTTTEDWYVNLCFADLNNDGNPEIVVRNKVYAAESGILLAAAPAGSNKGISYAHQGNYSSNHKPLKVASPCIANMDESDDVLEIVLGNEIYKPSITNRMGESGNSLTLWRSVSPPAGVQASDGHAQVADFNMDGHLDVFISNRYVPYPSNPNSGTVAMYVWDVHNSAVSTAQTLATTTVGKSIPLIADIDGDGALEVVIQCCAANPYGAGMLAFRFNSMSSDFSFLWRIAVNEDSFSNGVTCFDFNQDGALELLVCDQKKIRFFDGAANELSSFSFGEVTIMQYPIIADVDNDGHAEIVSVGNISGTTSISGSLNIFKSAGAPWAPARPVWNQYMYNVTHVNKDLTVPRYLFNNAIAFVDDSGTVRRPFNNFLQQATQLDSFGRPFYGVPDVYVTSASDQADDDIYTLTVCFANQGSAPLNAPYGVTVYADRYRGDVLRTVQVTTALSVADTHCLNIILDRQQLCDLGVSGLVAAVNDAGTGVAQRGGQHTECDTLNNAYTLSYQPYCMPDTVRIYLEGCDSLPFRGATLLSDTLICDTLLSVGGFDSIVQHIVAIHHSSPMTIVDTAVCDAFYYVSIDSVFSASALFDSVYANAAGCDSVVSLHLTVNNSSIPVMVPVADCDSFYLAALDTTFYPASNGPFSHTLTNVVGCDSVVMLNLALRQSTAARPAKATACEAYVWEVNGQSYTATGVWLDTILNAAGCDSLLTLSLYIAHYPSLNVTSDTTVVSCSPLTLCASGSDNYLWQSSPALSGDTLVEGDSSVVTVRPSATETYHVKSYSGLGNVVVNGDFEQGNIGFYTDYAYDARQNFPNGGLYNVLAEGAYVVGGNAHDYHDYFSSVRDHTSLSGNYMIINGSDHVGDIIWSQPVTLVPGFYYDISLWTVTVCGGSDARPQFYIGGQPIDSPIQVGGRGTWRQYTFRWFNDSLTATEITLINQCVARAGNDFGIDDISMRPVVDSYEDLELMQGVCVAERQVTVTVVADTVRDEACDRYRWGRAPEDSVDIENGGLFVDTVFSADGLCDSLVALSLAFGFSSSAPPVVADVCDSFVWDATAMIYRLTNIYRDTLPRANSQGCDSVRTLDLTVRYSSPPSTNYGNWCDWVVWSVTGLTYTESGLYIDSSLNAAGCDSLNILSLTMRHSSAAQTVDTDACDRFLWRVSSDTLLIRSGLYRDTLPGANSESCDSLISINLHIHHSDTVHVSIAACDSFYWPPTGQTFTASTSHTDTLSTLNGCDSVVRLTLTIRRSSPLQLLDTSVCDRYRWPVDGVSYVGDTSLTVSFFNVEGCDSALSLRLRVPHSYVGRQTVVECDRYRWPANDSLYRQTATDTLSLLTSSGCDSVLILNLTMHYSDTVRQSVAVCDNIGYTFGGQRLSQSGTYAENLRNADGCDSMLLLSLTVHPSYDYAVFDTVDVDSLPYVAFNGVGYREELAGLPISYSTVNGCDSVVRLYLAIRYSPPDCERMYFPNLVSPNGDGYNDTFLIRGFSAKCWPKSDLRIYNRWGLLVFHDVDIKSEAGGWNPSNLPAGTYYYSFQARGPLGSTERHGVIELVK